MSTPSTIQEYIRRGEQHMPTLQTLHQFQTYLQIWQNNICSIIDGHVARFTAIHGIATAPKPCDVSETQIVSSTTAQRPQPNCHEALCIPELLECILRNLQPADQFRAWQVCLQWQAVIDRIMPCAPVEYGQCGDPSLFWLQPTQKELQSFEQQVLRLRDYQLRGEYPPDCQTLEYIPAYITQAGDVPEHISDAFRSLHVNAYSPFHWLRDSRISYDLPAAVPRWLDFSQFEINPYFAALLEGRFAQVSGTYEIALAPDLPMPEALLAGASLPPGDFHQSLVSMFLTQPPCKCLGIYTGDRRLLQRLKDEDGIRIGQLLGALRCHAPQCTTRWVNSVTEIRRRIAEARGLSQLDGPRCRLFFVPPSPTFILALGNGAMRGDWEGRTDKGGHFTRYLYMRRPRTFGHDWERDVFRGMYYG